MFLAGLDAVVFASIQTPVCQSLVSHYITVFASNQTPVCQPLVSHYISVFASNQTPVCQPLVSVYITDRDYVENIMNDIIEVEQVNKFRF
jgi:hypothetical protein